MPLIVRGVPVTRLFHRGVELTSLYDHGVRLFQKGQSSTTPPPVTPPPPAAEAFVLGVTEPTALNTGTVASGREFPTTVQTGSYTVPANTTIRDVIFDGFVTLSSGSVLENCVIRGPLTYSGNTFLVRSVANHAVRPELRFCDIIPQAPSAYVSGVGSKFYRAYRCYVDQTVDAFGAFSSTTDGLTNVAIEGCFVPRMVRFAPDYANGNRAESHADGMQAQGNNAPGVGASDIIIRGNSFNARWHPTLGNPPASATAAGPLSCFMVSVNTPNQTTVNATIDQNWLRSGGKSATINAGTYPGGGALVITGNRMERPGFAADGPNWSILLDPDARPNATVSGNTYIDQPTTAVPITNG